MSGAELHGFVCRNGAGFIGYLVFLMPADSELVLVSSSFAWRDTDEGRSLARLRLQQALERHRLACSRGLIFPEFRVVGDAERRAS